MSTNDIGTTLAIATGIPATNDEAGFEALTWAAIGGLVSVGEIGDEHETINVPDLTTGRIRVMKGAAVGTSVSIALREIVGNAGQAAAKAAAEALGAEYSFRITEPGGAVQYIAGVAHSWKRTERSTGSYAGFTFAVTTNYTTVEVAA